MKSIDPQLVKDTAAQLRISKSLHRQLNLSVLADMPESSWEHYELFGLPTKNNLAGILFLAPHDDLYAIAYEINAIPAGTTGRTKPIICDFCKTWQTGGRAGTFLRRSTASCGGPSLLAMRSFAAKVEPIHVRNVRPL